MRLDFRGFGPSSVRPRGPLSPVDDVLGTLDELGVGRCHLVGASFGAGVAVEANVAWRVDGPRRGADEVAPAVRGLVRRMRRRATE